MGYTSYSAKEYDDRLTMRAASGKSAMNYNDDVITNTPHSERKIHDSLNPNGVVRESLDVPGKPPTTPIIIAFDVTGSMNQVPRQVQKSLPKLLGILLRNSYVENPQILVAAIGDVTSDQAPFQAGQFESGAEMEDGLANMWLEGCGGGQKSESYELALYFAARKTKTSAKARGEKGYLIMTGDEMARSITKSAALKVFGDTIQSGITFKDILAECQEDWEVHFIMPGGTASYWDDKEVNGFWRGHLGQSFHKLEDPEQFCEKVAAIIGTGEGRDHASIEADIVASGGKPGMTKDLVVRTKEVAVAVPSSGKKNAVAVFN